MKNILMPTDFSENSWNAIKYGMELFKKTTCVFYLIHINPIRSYAGGEPTLLIAPDVLEETILKESKEKLQNLLKEIEQLPFNTKHTFHTLALHGFFTDHIQQQVKDKHIDLIIMGTKGASGLKAVALGSNTGNVIAKVKCSILTIPENTKYKKPQEIGFPTDFGMGYHLKTLQNLKDLVLLHNSVLRLLYISLDGEDFNQKQIKNKEILDTYFQGTDHKFHKITGEKLAPSIRCFSESRDLDILVMVTKNLNFIESIFFRPTVEKISFQIKTPLLVIHEIK